MCYFYHAPKSCWPGPQEAEAEGGFLHGWCTENVLPVLPCTAQPLPGCTQCTGVRQTAAETASFARKMFSSFSWKDPSEQVTPLRALWKIFKETGSLPWGQIYSTKVLYLHREAFGELQMKKKKTGARRERPVWSWSTRLWPGSPTLSCLCKVRFPHTVSVYTAQRSIFIQSSPTWVHFESQQGGKAWGLWIKAPEKLNLNVSVCRYNVGKNGKQWRSFGQLLPVLKRICHEDSGSCCLVSNCFSKKINIFF